MSIASYWPVGYDTRAVSFDDTPEASDPPEHADTALAARAAAGDLQAFEDLVRRYRNDVYALSYHFVRNREDAWDISQEVFIKAYRAIGRFRGESSFKTWLLRIAANHCKDTFKRRKIPTVAFDEALGTDQHPQDGLAPDQAMAARELGAAIEQAIDGLSPIHKTAFLLREFEDLSYQQMAEVMQCSLGTVMSRLHHARKKLQRALRDMGIGEEL